MLRDVRPRFRLSETCSVMVRSTTATVAMHGRRGGKLTKMMRVNAVG